MTTIASATRLDPHDRRAVIDGVLRVRRCAHTHRPQEWRYGRCTCCWEDAFESVSACGIGTLVAAATYHRTYDESHIHPYVVAVVRLDEGIDVIAGCGDTHAWRIGDRVAVRVDPSSRLRVERMAATHTQEP